MNQRLMEKVSKVTEQAQQDQSFYDSLVKVSTPQELASLCETVGLNISSEEAAAGFDILQASILEGETRELSDNELDRIAAGSGAKLDDGTIITPTPWNPFPF